MDQRKQQVLQAIVALYTNDGEPIGSQLLSEYMNLAVSTATLRNEMAALTKLGLLEQPHTSAGRIPSGAGYRYYIDHLMDSSSLMPAQARRIEAEFESFDYDPPKLVQQAAHALAKYTGLMVAATTPRSEDIRIVHFQITQVGRSAAAVLAVTSAGGVLTRVAHTPGQLTEEQLRMASPLINRALAFLTTADLNPVILKGLELAFGEEASLLMPLAKAAVTLLLEAGKAVTAVEGIQNLLRYPETEGHLRELLDLGSDPARLARWVVPTTDRLTVSMGGIQSIGEEIDLPDGLSVISKGYLAGGGQRGGIALIGPVRIPYRELAPVLEYYASLLGRAMSGVGSA